VKESQAKDRLCPFFSIASGIGLIGIASTPEINFPTYEKAIGEYTAMGPALCKASACMMWRDSSSMDEKTGYCGLVK
jgi:hypothetical protein